MGGLEKRVGWRGVAGKEWEEGRGAMELCLSHRVEACTG